MFLRGFAEVVLLVLIFATGIMWWQLRKRSALVKRIIKDEVFLTKLISKDALESPIPLSNRIAHVSRFDIALRADQTAQRIPTALTTIVFLLVCVASYFLGSPYLWTNVGVFLALGFVPITESARNDASGLVLTLATILDRWRIENAPECDAFVAQSRTIQKLYDAVSHQRDKKDKERITNLASASSLDGPEVLAKEEPQDELLDCLGRVQQKLRDSDTSENPILDEDHVGRCDQCGAEIAGRRKPIWIVDVERQSDGTPVAMTSKPHSCFLNGISKAMEERVAKIAAPPKSLRK